MNKTNAWKGSPGTERRALCPTRNNGVRAALLQAAAVCLVLGLPAFAAAAERCTGGRYLVEGDLPFFPEEDGRTIIVVTDAGVSMEPCGPAARSWVRSTKTGLVARAAWPNCRLARGRVKLKLRTSNDCETGRGVVTSRKPRSRWRFAAERGCEFAILCSPHTTPIDTNGDGCHDSCEPAPGHCLADSDCAADFYCRRDTGMCGDAPGTCAIEPEVCIEVWDPVCGCDGETYSNDCYAARAGANVAYDGACAEQTRFCGDGPVTDECRFDLDENACAAAGGCWEAALFGMRCGCPSRDSGRPCEPGGEPCEGYCEGVIPSGNLFDCAEAQTGICAESSFSGCACVGFRDGFAALCE